MPRQIQGTKLDMHYSSTPHHRRFVRSITNGSGGVGFMSLVIAGPSPPVPEPLVMCTHHRRFVSGTVGDGDINTAG